MKTPVAKEKIIAISAGIILLAAVITGFIFINTNAALKGSLNNEKLRNESLLSEKLLLDKEILRFTNERSVLKGKNSETTKLLTDAQLKLTEKERVIAGLRKENARVKSLQKQLAEIKVQNEELNNSKNQLGTLNKSLENDKQQLQKTVAQLETDRNELLKQLDLVRAESLRKADNYQVDIYKNVKREVPTFKAKRMKMMSVIVDVPKELASGVTFNITTPDGKVINEKNKSLTWKILSNDATLTAIVNRGVDDFTVTRQVKLTYSPSTQMKPGMYKIGILDNGNNIGNCSARLR